MRVWAVVAVAAVLAAPAAAVRKTQWHMLDNYSFEDYKREFGKTYASTAEHNKRQAIFEERLAGIRRHNAAGHSWKEGVNHMSDWTVEEFKQLLGYKKAIGYSMHKPAPAGYKSAVNVGDLPTNVDWRKSNVVTAVKDQGRCGSCWSFGSAETLESQVAIKTGILEVLSEQNILDCTPNPKHCGGTGGCQGGTAELAYARMAADGGLQTEWTYPYISHSGNNYQCKFDKSQSVVNVTGYTKNTANNYEDLLGAIANRGPVSISVEAIHWMNYESGIFNGCNQTNPDIDHNVVLVGYGQEQSGDGYWLVRNSWTPHWGEHGYIRLLRQENEGDRCGEDITPLDGSGCEGGPSKVKVCGACGILFDTVIPEIAV